MMKSRLWLVPAIALVMSVGGVAALSWVRPQEAAHDGSQHADHDREGDGSAEAQHHEHNQEEGERAGGDPPAHDIHDGGGEDEHEAHDQSGEHLEDDDHIAEMVVRLSDKERETFVIELATAGRETLSTRIRLPGEIVLNGDRVAHIVPRAPGIVREVLKKMGDTVRAGEVMAWLESAELGEAKVDYLAKWAELGCCTIDLTRAQEVHDNTMRFLKVLESSPSLEVLRKMNEGSMGEYRSDLVSAYAEFVFTEAAFERERRLLEKKVASESEYQATENAYKKANALYTAKRDSIDFKIRRDLSEAKRAQQVREMQLKGAERRLYVLGMTGEEIGALEPLAGKTTGAEATKAECNDPNCRDCAKDASKGVNAAAPDLHVVEERLAWYPLRAPFDGTVIARHLTLGEKHGDDSDAFTVADLSSVWVDISVYQKDLRNVSKGQVVRILAGEDTTDVEGVISFVAPIVDERTRTALARVVLPNPKGEWRPGVFVTAKLSTDEQSTFVVVPKAAIQRIGQEPVVFVETDKGLRPTHVSVGRSDESRVEILSGLEPGQRYVTDGAFELKAKIVTTGLGAHAGHGH